MVQKHTVCMSPSAIQPGVLLITSPEGRSQHIVSGSRALTKALSSSVSASLGRTFPLQLVSNITVKTLPLVNIQVMPWRMWRVVAWLAV